MGCDGESRFSASDTCEAMGVQLLKIRMADKDLM